MIRLLFFLVVLFIGSSSTFSTKPRATLDEFFDHTTFSIIGFSPNGQHLLFQTRQPSWKNSSYENTLWIYDIAQQTKRLITQNLQNLIQPRWSPSGKWIALFLDETPSNVMKNNYYHRLRRSLSSSSELTPAEQRIYLYSIDSNELRSIEIGKDLPIAMTWSDNDATLYLATTNLPLTNEDEEEWRDVTQYRESRKYERSIIHRVDIRDDGSLLAAEKKAVINISSFMQELLYVSGSEKLIFSSVLSLFEDMNDFELYSIDLRNPSSLTKLTKNEGFEGNLKLSEDKQHLTFTSFTYNATPRISNNSQSSIYLLNLTTGLITRLGKNFDGSIYEYTVTSDGEIYFLGQLGTEVQIYFQRTPSDEAIPLKGWNGSYNSIVSSRQNSFAFVHSSTDKPMEVYLASDIDQLLLAQPITDDNKIFMERDLPQAKVYQWKNPDDEQTVEGILHYPPGQYEAKNLPLLVLIHGGPYSASVNQFLPDWYSWAPIAASEGWLVLEPNYRGSSGYGDQFLNEIFLRPLSLPGKDILYGVDQLVRDGIADPNQLAVGGYSYGGVMTNWLITQTKRFNAALSGAGIIEYPSAWGIMDIPILFTSLFGGHPWEVPHVYQNEAPLFQLDRVRTPTLINTGEEDVRVPASQSYMLERALYYQNVPVKLITFPNEGHGLEKDPWHGKIKIREELKWLAKYGHQSSS